MIIFLLWLACVFATTNFTLVGLIAAVAKRSAASPSPLFRL
jgi:hypothetical protein